MLRKPRRAQERVDFCQITLGQKCFGFSQVLDSSIFFGGFKVQRHTLSPCFANLEIKVRLFVAFGVLLLPQYQTEEERLEDRQTVRLWGSALACPISMRPSFPPERCSCESRSDYTRPPDGLGPIALIRKSKDQSLADIYIRA